MLRFSLHLVVASTTLISNFFVFASNGVAQDSPNCYMVTPSGQVITLNSMCERQDSPKAKACEGPFDDDGFPLALSNELEELKKVVNDAIKKDVLGLYDPEVHAALAKIYNKMPFSARIHALLQEQQQILLTPRKKPIEEKKIAQKYAANMAELLKNKCLVQLVNSLHRKGLGPLL